MITVAESVNNDNYGNYCEGNEEGHDGEDDDGGDDKVDVARDTAAVR